jgi:hypothetical protein
MEVYHAEDILAVSKKLVLKISVIAFKDMDGLQLAEKIKLLQVIFKKEMYLFIIKEVAVIILLMLSLSLWEDQILKLLAIVQIKKMSLILI